MPKVKPISLDGSTLEGGGQLTRVALCLAALTNTPIHIYKIRANRGPGARRTDATSGWKTSIQISGKHSNNSSNHKSLSKKLQASKEQNDHKSSTTISKSGGGLKESHLAALRWLAVNCDAYIEDAEVGSREVTFIPGAGSGRSGAGGGKLLRSRTDRSDLVDLQSNTITLQNPGSIWLIFQALYPFIVFGTYKNHTPTADDTSASASAPESTTLTLRGGTNVSQSMSADYVTQVFLPICHRIGLPETTISLIRRGWAGNAPQIGEVQITVQRPSPSLSSSSAKFHLPAFSALERGDITRIDVTVIANPAATRAQLIDNLREDVAEEFGTGVPVNVVVDEDSEDPRRMYVLLVARTSEGWILGGDFLGSGKMPKSAAELSRMVETAARTVTKQLGRELKRGGVVDQFMQDQLVVFQALAEGKSVVDGGRWKEEGGLVQEGDEECGDELGTLHTRTVRWVCGQILGRMGVGFRPGGECVGVGWNEVGVSGLGQKKLANLKLNDDKAT